MEQIKRGKLKKLKDMIKRQKGQRENETRTLIVDGDDFSQMSNRTSKCVEKP